MVSSINCDNEAACSFSVAIISSFSSIDKLSATFCASIADSLTSSVKSQPIISLYASANFVGSDLAASKRAIFLSNSTLAPSLKPFPVIPFQQDEKNPPTEPAIPLPFWLALYSDSNFAISASSCLINTSFSSTFSSLEFEFCAVVVSLVSSILISIYSLSSTLLAATVLPVF